MLRRAGRLTVVAAAARLLLLDGRGCRRGLHTSSLLHDTPRSGEEGGKGESKPAAPTDRDEDREELDRERRLREQFATKIQQQVWQGEGGNGGANAGVPPPGQRAMYSGMPAGSYANMYAAQRMLRVLFYLFAILLLVTLLPFASSNNSFYIMQGIPWWQLPIASAACFILLRSLYPRNEENRIKSAYEVAARANPRLTFDQFVNQQYPTLFQGYRTSQAEAIAAVAACLSAATRPNFIIAMRRAVGRVKDTRTGVDNIVDALRRDYPQLF